MSVIVVTEFEGEFNLHIGKDGLGFSLKLSELELLQLHSQVDFHFRELLAAEDMDTNDGVPELKVIS